MLDLKIGILHAYPNGELQFENYDQAQDTASQNEVRFKARLDKTEQEITETNLDSLARAMSMGASSVNVKSCF
jgi:hypothetical protein